MPPAPGCLPRWEFHARTQATYDHYQNMWLDSCEDALEMAQDAHCQALVAVAMLEGYTERLSCSITLGGLAAVGNWAATSIHIVKDA